MNDIGPYPLEWIDEYVARLRGFVVVREEDSLLIKVPNEAHKLNASAVGILKRLFAGEGILQLWESHGRSPQVQRDLYLFFVGLKQVLQGCVNERRPPEAVTTRPFSRRFSSLPVLSEVAVTYRCNLRCRFCYAGCGCTRSRESEPEMTTSEIRRVLRIIQEEAQVPSLSLTGGEPTLRKDLPELARYARQECGLRVNLISNGTLIDDVLAGELSDAGLTSAQVSLESHNEAIHDELTRANGSFRRTIAGIGHLRDHGIRVHTNTTLNRMNIETADAMPAFVRSLGLERFSMNLVIPTGTSRAMFPDINLRYGDVSEAVLRIQDQARRNNVEFLWYSPTPVCIFNPIQHQLGNKGCAACDGLLSVSPRGDVLPCSSWPEPLGNLLRDGFRKTWESARARRLREKECAPPRCHECENFDLCQGACPLYWEHFGYQELDRSGETHVVATS
ncbi:MAG: radical SAM protein [Candidatus Hydrogenedentes bacterium]|nr:radical SAM protein [Candidatus Hydrogenedentota bacterium]